MNFVTVSMLTGDRAKYLGLVFAVVRPARKMATPSVWPKVRSAVRASSGAGSTHCPPVGTGQPHS
jgi:hypothetical protein